MCVRNRRPNHWTDHHQIWHEGRETSGKCYKHVGSDVTKPEVTPQATKWHLKTKLGADHHQIWHEGRGLSKTWYAQKGSCITKPEVTSQTGSHVTRLKVTSQAKKGIDYKTKLGAGHHQILHEGRRWFGKCYRQTGSEVTKPEVTSQIKLMAFKDKVRVWSPPNLAWR